MKTTTRSQTIVISIRRAIANHDIAPGTPLKEDNLCEIFAVSRTVVREALQQLAKEKLVFLEPGRGASIAQPTRKEARDIFQLRTVMERCVIDQLIDTATPQTIARLKAHLSKERNALEKGDGAATIRLGADFHSLLAKEAGNELIAELTDELLARIALIMVLYKHSYSAHSHCLQDEHQQLVECIERKDRDRALALVGSHLGSVESSLMTEETSEAGLLKQVLLRNLPEQEER